MMIGTKVSVGALERMATAIARLPHWQPVAAAK